MLLSSDFHAGSGGIRSDGDMGTTFIRILAGVVMVAALGVGVFALNRNEGPTALTSAVNNATGQQPSSSGDPAGNTGSSGNPNNPDDPDEQSGETSDPGAPPDLGPREDLVDISQWLNTSGDSFEDVRSEVTVVQFWTFGCSNCQATIPHLQDLYAANDDRVEIVGVHAHEFDRERDPANVDSAVDDLGVTWPVALDTNKTNFRSWQGSTRFWPRTYVIDSEDRVRFDHIGEGQYGELSATVGALLDGQ